MLSKTKLILFIFLGLVLIPSNAKADPLSRENVPDPLKPWIDWVLRGDVTPCPYLDSTEGSRICSWSSKLNLSLSDKTGSFNQVFWTFTALKDLSVWLKERIATTAVIRCLKLPFSSLIPLCSVSVDGKVIVENGGEVFYGEFNVSRTTLLVNFPTMS